MRILLFQRPCSPPLGPIWAPKGFDQEFRASRGPLWAVHPIQMGAPGRPFGRPEVAPEGLGAIFEMLRKRWFLFCFEPLDRSSGIKRAKKKQKWETRTHLASRRPGSNRNRKVRARENVKKEAKRPKRKQKRVSKSYNSDWPEGCQN